MSAEKKTMMKKDWREVVRERHGISIKQPNNKINQTIFQDSNGDIIDIEVSISEIISQKNNQIQQESQNQIQKEDSKLNEPLISQDNDAIDEKMKDEIFNLNKKEFKIIHTPRTPKKDQSPKNIDQIQNVQIQQNCQKQKDQNIQIFLPKNSPKKQNQKSVQFDPLKQYIENEILYLKKCIFYLDQQKEVQQKQIQDLKIEYNEQKVAINRQNKHILELYDKIKKDQAVIKDKDRLIHEVEKQLKDQKAIESLLLKQIRDERDQSLNMAERLELKYLNIQKDLKSIIDSQRIKLNQYELNQINTPQNQQSSNIKNFENEDNAIENQYFKRNLQNSNQSCNPKYFFQDSKSIKQILMHDEYTQIRQGDWDQK